jgi:hypothetical protein
MSRILKASTLADNIAPTLSAATMTQSSLGERGGKSGAGADPRNNASDHSSEDLKKATGVPLSTYRSFMRLTEQTQFLADRSGGISNLVDRALQLVFCHTEMLGPVVDFMRLAHGNVAAVALALIEKIVAHLFLSCVTRKTSPGGGEAFRCLAAHCS